MPQAPWTTSPWSWHSSERGPGCLLRPSQTRPPAPPSPALSGLPCSAARPRQQCSPWPVHDATAARPCVRPLSCLRANRGGRRALTRMATQGHLSAARGCGCAGLRLCGAAAVRGCGLCPPSCAAAPPRMLLVSCCSARAHPETHVPVERRGFQPLWLAVRAGPAGALLPAQPAFAATSTQRGSCDRALRVCVKSSSWPRWPQFALPLPAHFNNVATQPQGAMHSRNPSGIRGMTHTHDFAHRMLASVSFPASAASAAPPAPGPTEQDFESVLRTVGPI